MWIFFSNISEKVDLLWTADAVTFVLFFRRRKGSGEYNLDLICIDLGKRQTLHKSETTSSLSLSLEVFEQNILSRYYYSGDYFIQSSCISLSKHFFVTLKQINMRTRVVVLGQKYYLKSYAEITKSRRKLYTSRS